MYINNRKIYYFITIILLTALFSCYSIFHLIESYKNIQLLDIKTKVEKVGYRIERDIKNKIDSFIWSFEDGIFDDYNNWTNGSLSLTKIRRFLSVHQDFVNSVTVIDSNIKISMSKDKNNYFVLNKEKFSKNIYEGKTYFYDEDKKTMDVVLSSQNKKYFVVLSIQPKFFLFDKIQTEFPENYNNVFIILPDKYFYDIKNENIKILEEKDIYNNIQNGLSGQISNISILTTFFNKNTYIKTFYPIAIENIKFGLYIYTQSNIVYEVIIKTIYILVLSGTIIFLEIAFIIYHGIKVKNKLQNNDIETKILLENMNNASDEFIYIKDSNLNYIFANDKFCNLINTKFENIKESINNNKILLTSLNEVEKKALECKKYKKNIFYNDMHLNIVARVMKNKDKIIGICVIIYDNTKIVLKNMEMVREKKNLSNLIKNTTIELNREKEQSKQHRLDLANASMKDFLTGLPNRGAMIKKINDLIIYGEQFCIAFIDFNNFKSINDTMGHKAGDKVLKEISNRIQKYLDDNIYFYRLGGDEFLIVFENLCKDPLQYINNIQQLFDNQIIVDDTNILVSFCGGISFYPKDGNTVDELIKNADLAMYHSKETGHDCITVFEEKMNTDIMRKIILSNKLRESIKAKEIQVFYQPILDRNQNIVGSEALSRWICNDEYISPDIFIKIAENNGMIKSLFESIIDKIINDMKKYIIINPNFKVSINISSKQLHENNFADYLYDKFRYFGVNPKNVILELTETAIISDTEKAYTIMKKLSDYGFNISLDDFGTGYSSLMYLKKFPITCLKIDKSFILDIYDSKDSLMITNSIISLGKNLGISVLAEGIETKKHFDKLYDMNCIYFQGYYFSKPVPIELFDQLKGL